MSGEKKPIMCVDFDGVIHSYKSGWQGPGCIPDPPVPGAFLWLKELMDAGFEVCIYSARSCDYRGHDAMKDWFRLWKFKPADELKFPTQKPPATMTIDDRAFCFEGDFPSPEYLKNFIPWHQRVKKGYEK